MARPRALVAVATVAIVGGGLLWIPSHRPTARSARADIVDGVAAFKPRMALLEMILEPPGLAVASQTIRPVPARSLAPLYRHFAGHRPLPILVVGDSVGVTFANGLKLWANEYGNARVLDASHMWCALGRGLPISHGIAIQNPGRGCDDWGSRWADDVAWFDPDVVFVNFTIWEMAPRQLPGHTDLLQPGAPALDTWQLSEYRAAAGVLSARGAQILWFTIPCENEPIRRGSPFWVVNRRTIPKLAASRPAVHVVDLDHELCVRGPSHEFAGVAQAGFDGAHFSPAGALAVANWVMPIVLGRAPNPRTSDETVPPAPSATRYSNSRLMLSRL
jgi:hypothetical protein